MPAQGAQLGAGSVLAGYRIDELIGRGGMGLVYRATDLALDRVCALKVLAPELAGDERFRRRLQREMRLAASLRHPNVVAIHHAGVHDGLLFLVMDFISGPDLRELVRQSGPIEPRDATGVLAQLASALDAAHAQGLVHRDVKPANVLVANEQGGRRAYLTDFGLARKSESDSGSTAITQSGMIVGTVDYMAPEQIIGGKVDSRTDIYSLGCVCVEMLTGAAPYARETTLMAKLFAHVHEPPPRLEGRLLERYPKLGPVIERAMAKDPDARHQSAGEFASDAAAAVGNDLSAALTPAPADEAPARLRRVGPAVTEIARRFDTLFVNRERELRLLHDAWGRAVVERSCHLFTVLGEAGVGKSRLVAELLDGIGEAGRVLRGRCLPYGEGITFSPLTEALTPLGDDVAPVIERLRAGRVAAPEELFLELRRLLETLAAEHPVILFLDDLQWAEAMLLDFLDHLVDLARGPMLVLCVARLELLDIRQGWGGGKLNATTALLGALAAAESRTLLDALAGELDPETRARVLAASEGNPLFLEEMAALARERGRVSVPATIQALLAERLAGLAGEEREVLECAAVEGEVFHRDCIVSLVRERPPRQVDSQLASLVRKQLIRPNPPTLTADDAFRFRHLLIRDAAYEAVPAELRAKLHRRLADWLEHAAVQIAERDEIAGWHLEQALRGEQELGHPIDAALARRAAVRLHAAGRRARDRGDAAAATNLFERALPLAPPGERARAQIAADLAERFVEAGELARADELLCLAELERDAGPLVALTRFEWMIRARPREATQTIGSELPGILRRLAEAGDHGGMARAHLVASMPHWLASHWTPAREQSRLAADHAHQAGDDGLRARALAFYVGAIVYGQDATEAIARELDAIEREEPGASLAARVTLARGQLARLEGRFPDARRFMQSAMAAFEALGMRELVAACDHELGVTELSAGDAAAALRWLRRSDALLVDLGQHSLRSTTQALVAQTQLSLHDHAAARAAIDLAEGLCAPEDALTFAITHQVRSGLALAANESEAAERWARSAVAEAFRTDSLVLHADARLNLAGVLKSLGRRDEAVVEARSALELSAAKGDRPGAAHAHVLLDRL